MSESLPPEISSESENPSEIQSILSILMWLFFLYLPSVMLSIIFVIYGSNSAGVVDVEHWLKDGDVNAVFSICMALITLPVLKIALEDDNIKNKRAYLGLANKFSFENFRPWLALTFVYISFGTSMYWLLDMPMSAWMVSLASTTDNLVLSTIALVIVAPIFEELIFRGYIFSKLQATKVGNYGAVIITAVVFTAIHNHYQIFELLDIFVLAILLSFVRLKANNLYYCIIIHMVNNLVAFIVLNLN